MHISLQAFLTRDHASIRDAPSALLVGDDTPDASLIQSGCVSHYVELVGTVSRPENAWELIRVERVINLDDLSTCWSRPTGD